MSLQPITKPSSFFIPCGSEAEIPHPSMAPTIRKISEAMINIQNKEDMEKLLREQTQQYPKLLTSAGSTAPLIHTLAQYAKHKSMMEVCVQIGGRAVLEVGGSSDGETPIFKIDSYRSLKRLTDLNAQVNVRSKTSTVLEHLASKGWFRFTGSEFRRCIKHLIRLGGCIQENSPLTEENRMVLTSVYREFLSEISTVREKIKVVAQCIHVTVLQTIILDYAYGEEDSETCVYDDRGRYALDDETEAYAYIKSRASSAS